MAKLRDGRENATPMATQVGATPMQDANVVRDDGARAGHHFIFEGRAARLSLVGGDLSYRDLRGAVLWGRNLQAAYLAGADLREGNLKGVILAGAHLEAVDLSAADLRGADLRGATLTTADLSGVDLRAADLRGADLRWARFERAILDGAFYNEETRFPDGFVPDDRAMTFAR